MRPLVCIARALLGLEIAVGLTGCIRVVNEPAKPDEGIAVAASALQRDDGTFLIDDDAVDSIARRADVTPDELKKMGFTPGRYTKPHVGLLILKLRTDDEQYLLSTMARKLAGADAAAPGNPQGTTLDNSSIKDTFLAWARERFKNPELTMSDVWKKREATLRTVTAKDAARQWVLTRVTNHDFNPALSLTIEVVSTNSVPLLASQRAYLILDDANQMALTRKQTSCNDAGTACRYVYSRAGKHWDRAWVAVLDRAQQRQAKEDVGEAVTSCDASTCPENVEFQVQVAGHLMKQSITLAYLNVANAVDDDAADPDSPEPSGASAVGPER